MPNGLWYAGGVYTRESIKAGSAFSKGDMLALDSNSSLSRLNPYAIAAGALIGVADSDSTNSVDGLCNVIIPGPDTVFWSMCTASQTLLKGENSSISFDAAKPGRYWVDESTSTSGIVVVKGTNEIDQSSISHVLVKFAYAQTAQLDLS